MTTTVIAGVGICPFGRRLSASHRELGSAAAREALRDAGIRFSDVDQTFVASVGGGAAKAQNIAMSLGAARGAPIVSVEAGCGSSGSALHLGKLLIESGAAQCVLCVGAEKTPAGYVEAGYETWQEESGLAVNPAYFALEAVEFMAATGTTEADLAEVSVKNHRHGALNPNATYRSAVTREEVLASTAVCDPLRLLMLCSPVDGAAAAVLMSQEAARRHGVTGPVTLLAVSVVSRIPTDGFVPMASRIIDGRTSFAERAAHMAFEEAGVGPADLDLVECQDVDSSAELRAYSYLGLCAPGNETALLRSGATALGGSQPVNPSGGLLSKGEPLGASGLGQVHELVTQVRGRAEARQVQAARIGMAHVFGAGHTASGVIVSA